MPNLVFLWETTKETPYFLRFPSVAIRFSYLTPVLLCMRAKFSFIMNLNPIFVIFAYITSYL